MIIFDAEVAEVMALNLELTGKNLAEEALRREIATIQATGGDLKKILAGLDGMLNTTEKKR